MSDIAIRVEGLSKAYQIRHTQARSSYHFHPNSRNAFECQIAFQWRA